MKTHECNTSTSLYYFTRLDSQEASCNVLDLSVRPLPTCERYLLKTNEPISMQNGTSGPAAIAVDLWGQEVKGQGHTRPKLD